MIRTAIVKLLLTLTISSMVALAVMGGYIVAMRSQDNPIVAPQQPSLKTLPSQAPSPRRIQPKKYSTPSPDWNLDIPGPR